MGCKGKFGEEAGRMIYQNSLLLFRELALAVVIAKRILLVHGGLPAIEDTTGDFRIRLSRAQENYLTERTLEEILWNDPRNIEGAAGWEPSRRGVGRHFGQAVTDIWLKAMGTACLVRGHEPCKGYRLDHDDKILTLFSSKEPYPTFDAAYLKINGEDIAGIQDARSLLRFVRYPLLP